MRFHLTETDRLFGGQHGIGLQNDTQNVVFRVGIPRPYAQIQAGFAPKLENAVAL